MIPPQKTKYGSSSLLLPSNDQDPDQCQVQPNVYAWRGSRSTSFEPLSSTEEHLYGRGEANYVAITNQQPRWVTYNERIVQEAKFETLFREAYMIFCIANH